MASSRWKRFAFFERHTLNLSNDVLDDLIATDSSSQQDDGVTLVTTTAALPVASKTAVVDKAATTTTTAAAGAESNDNSNDNDAMTAMWSSLTACTSPTLPAEQDQNSISLPSQIPAVSPPPQRPLTSLTSVDGLVLSFVTSRTTDLVHCLDATVRCNPSSSASEAGGELMQDLDGWRGYFSPFGKLATPTTATTTTSSRNEPDKLVAIAVCRDIVTRSSSQQRRQQQQKQHNPIFLACIATNHVCVWKDPHLHLSCRRPLSSPQIPPQANIFKSVSPWNTTTDGHCLSVDVVPGLVAIGTTNGHVLILAWNHHTNTMSSSSLTLRTYLRIPPPPSSSDTTQAAVSVQLSLDRTDDNKASVFVAYRRAAAPTTTNTTATTTSTSTTAGICCYEWPLPSSSNTSLAAPSARHDLDGRAVASASLVDSFATGTGLHYTVARLDGLYSYSPTERTGVAPIDGKKITLSVLPPPIPAHPVRPVAATTEATTGYALVASTDSKSGRDAVDIYDADNKLVAFHLLLSPGHRAVRSSGITTFPTLSSDGSVRSGRSSALVLTSGGQLVTLTEKLTAEKIALLVQKNLYSAAIVVAFADPSMEGDDITNLYRQYAEHLYRKGDFGGAMDQYIHTIGSLESSHVLYRYLDAPKIPHLVKYLEQLRTRGMASPVHNELLRTCYLKLNDTEAAEALATAGSRDIDKGSLASVFAKISTHPKEALATICSLDARQAAEVLVVHGASLARSLPRETAGVVLSLCVGTYSPKSLADAALVDANDLKKLLERKVDESEQLCTPYPAHLFASAFLEQPKMLRLLLAHCNRNKSPLTAALRRTLLELTLAEWNQAKRSGDTEAEKLRHKEAIAALTDSHCRDIGDYDALVIVQQAGFEEGELLLYERLQMTPMLLERYAKDGSEKSRRQMLAMSKTEPDVLADVLGHLVAIASEKSRDANAAGTLDDDSENDELNEIMDDIQEALSLARRQGVLPPVRIARILAGESSGQFSSSEGLLSVDATTNKDSIPLSVALDYVGSILEESRKEITRLDSEVEEYNTMCNAMEQEIEELLRLSNNPSPQGTPAENDGSNTATSSSRMNIDELYAKVRADELDSSGGVSSSSKRPAHKPTEAFWREMSQSEDSFDVIARYFAKGIIN